MEDEWTLFDGVTASGYALPSDIKRFNLSSAIIQMLAKSANDLSLKERQSKLLSAFYMAANKNPPPGINPKQIYIPLSLHPQPYPNLWVEIKNTSFKGQCIKDIDETIHGLFISTNDDIITVKNWTKPTSGIEGVELKEAMQWPFDMVISTTDPMFALGDKIRTRPKGKENDIFYNNAFFNNAKIRPNDYISSNPAIGQNLLEIFKGAKRLNEISKTEQDIFCKMVINLAVPYWLWMQAVLLVDNRMLLKQTIETPSVSNNIGNGIIGESDHVITTSTKPQNIITPKPSESHDGTPQRRHWRRGHYTTRGTCKEGKSERTNLCDPKTTIDPRKEYCGKCGKRLTWKLAYEAGRNYKGKINQTYKVT